MSKKAYHSYKCLSCGKGHQAKVERGLCYIVHSPPPEHGGFDPQTVNVAGAAIREIRKLRRKAQECEQRFAAYRALNELKGVIQKQS